MRHLFIVALFAFVSLSMSAQQANFRFAEIPESHQKTLVRNAVSPSNTLFDYVKAAAGKYPQDQGFLLHLNIYQIDPVDSGGWLYWTLDKSEGPGSIILVYVKEKSDFLRVGSWAHFFCFYERTLETTLTDLNTGNQRKRTVPLFRSDLFGIRIIYE